MMYDIPASANEVPRLEDYLRAMRERWRLILLVLALFIVAVILFDRARTPVYQGQARVVANPSIETSTNTNTSAPVLEREKEVLASIAVATRASEILGDGSAARSILEDLDVRFVNRSDTLEVLYPDPDPDRAASVVNAMVDAYVEQREAGSLAVYTSQIEELDAELSELNERVVAISSETSRQNTARTRAAALPTTDPTRQAQIDEAAEAVTLLNQERGLVNNTITQITREQRQLERQLASRRPAAEVIQYATAPENPTGPGRNLLIAGGVLFGSIAGVALAFVMQRLDRTAKESGDVEAAIGTSVLGNVPAYGVTGRRTELMMLSTAKSSRVQRVREAYRRLRASLQFLQTSREVSSFLVTSARPGEGKSSTVANLGVAAAQAGSRVVIVSADLRRPMQERLFGVSSPKGLSDYLADASVTDILVPVTDVPGLVIVPAGPLPPNPGELLGTPRFKDLIAELSEQFDLVLVDMPPVLSTADAGTASPLVDGVLVVVDSQRTDTDSLLRVRTTIERSGGTIVGAVLNKDSSDSGISLRRDRYAYEKVASQR